MLAAVCVLSLLATVTTAWTPQSRALALQDDQPLTKRWLPSSDKIRGVNLGSQFIVERWMAETSWERIGCADYNDEWACVEGIGQEAADAGFRTHWETWTTENDIRRISDLGLNTVRIPVGFWIRESLVYDDEHYPRGGLPFLDRIVGWCKKYGIYVIMDLHGGPGVQTPNEQFTGHSVPEPGFYTPENYERALQFLEWMTERIHTNGNYTTVGMLQVINEPVHVKPWMDKAADMIKTYYPQAYQRIEDKEKSLGIAAADRLHIQFMGTSWGSGDPREYLPSTEYAFFDAHRYLSFDKRVPGNKKGYITTACADDMGRNVVVGEWSLSVNSTLKNTDEFKTWGQETWYRAYWAAQASAFERSNGWLYWSWKCDGVGKDWRWCYEAAVDAGAIPEDAGRAEELSPCERYPE